MPARGGPYPRLRLDLAAKVSQGTAVVRLVLAGHSISSAAALLGLSVTTAWRRYWFVMDWTLPQSYGRPRGPIPPQRGTKACPRGRPYLPTLDERERRPPRARTATDDRKEQR